MCEAVARAKAGSRAQVQTSISEERQTHVFINNRREVLVVRILIVALVFLFGTISSAGAIVILPSSEVRIEGSVPHNPKAEDVTTLVGSSVPLVELYKQDVGAASDTGPFAGSYDTTFFNDPLDPAEALIEYVPAQPAISGSPLWLLVKDGNHDPIWYLFNLLNLTNVGGASVEAPYAWNGTDDIQLLRFWPANGAISHVAIYGGNATVPEPSTLLLLGSGVMGLGAVAWRGKSRG